MAFNRRETLLLLMGDLLVLGVSLWIALTLRNLAFPSGSYFLANLSPFVPFLLFSIIVFYISGLYEKQTRPIRRSMWVRIVGAQAATTGIAAILFFVLPLSIAPKTILVLYLVVSVVLVSVWRFFMLQREITRGRRVRALLIASGSEADELFDEVSHNSRLLISFDTRLDPSALSPDELLKRTGEVLAHNVRLLVIDLAHDSVHDLLPKLYACTTPNTRVVTFAELYEEIFDRVPLGREDTSALVDAVAERPRVYDTTKRIFDVLLALTLALIVVPLVALAALLLVLRGGAPFITTERVGKGGRVITLYKLRSMLFNDRGDPLLRARNRVTTLGKVLRKTRIDELPQLWNIVAGDLSFIGPRPELPPLVAAYEQTISEYRFRHLITPGLSGWAQIHDYDAPRGGVDVERTRRKLSFDLYYLKHRSFGLDMAIALKTLRALTSLSGT